jgi:uncharacterized protein (DUF1499 family)
MPTAMTQVLSRIAVILVALCAIVVAISGPGYRMGGWPLPVAFGMLRWGGWIAIGITVIAVVLALVAAFARPGGSRDGLAEAVVAIVIGALTMVGPMTLMSRGKQVPPIHDISTDTDNPPQFVAVLPLRAGAANPATYGGPDIAAQQKKAFPQIAPLEIPIPPERAFERALGAARDSGWTIVSADAPSGRIEATATTPFFGFKDDVVVRVGATGNGSRIDVRSLSRIGRSDLGQNARRVEGYLAKVKAG